MNVKGLEADVLDRLAAQARAEGMSQQEWVRTVLRRTASRWSPAELAAHRDQAIPMSETDFERVRLASAERRREARARLDGRERGR